MERVKLFDVNFGAINAQVYNNQNNKYDVTMSSGGLQLFSKSYPNSSCGCSSNSISGFPKGYKVLEKNESMITTFDFSYNNQKHGEIGINHDKKRVSLILDRFETKNSPTHPVPDGNTGTKIKDYMSNNNQHQLNQSVVAFSYTGADQTYTVPSNAKYVVAQCWGAGGASQGYGALPFYNTGNGGGGGYTESKITGISGKTLNVVVGGGGKSANNGTNVSATYGGGGSQLLDDYTNWGSASGGGRSSVQFMINNAYADIVTAGGGGGAGGNSISGSSAYYQMGSGGGGGGNVGADAESNSTLPAYGGFGGTQTAGGANGTTDSGTTANANNASQYIGGGGNTFGAGAGSGYYGGGYGGINSFDGFTSSTSSTTTTSTTTSSTNTSSPVSGSVLHLDASVSSSIKTSNGVITEWLDQSSSGANAIPFSGNSTYSATSQTGSLPGVSMDGTSLYSPLASGKFTNGVTWFAVLSNLANQTYNTILTRTDPNNKNYPGPWDIYNNILYAGNSDGGNIYGTDMTPVNLSNPFGASLAVFQSGPSTKESITIGSSTYSNATSDSYYQDTGNYIYIGSRGDQVTSFGGVFSEILIYNSILSADQITQNTNYLNAKWKLSTSSSSASLSSTFYNDTGATMYVQALVNGVATGSKVTIPYTATTPWNSGVVTVSAPASQITYQVTITTQPPVSVPYNVTTYPYGYQVNASSTTITVGAISASNAGVSSSTSTNGWVFGGGGGGSSYVNTAYGTIITMEQAEGPTVAGASDIPSSMVGTIGGGAVATNGLKGGANGQNGYVVLNIYT